jgi:transcription elongation GreA/GreB family factor
MGEKIDEMLVAASETDSPEVFNKLLEKIKEDKAILNSDDIKSGLDFLLESFGESVAKSKAKAMFCLDLAKLAPPSSEALSFALQRAFSKLNPTLLPNSEIIKATGVKKKHITPEVAAERFEVLCKLKKGIKFFSPSGRIIGTVQELDDLTSEIIVTWDNAGKKKNTKSLESALKEFVFFNEHKIFGEFAANIFGITAEEWRNTLSEIFISNPNDKIFEQMSQYFAGEKGTSLEDFKKWWQGEPLNEKKSFDRHPSEARTIHELHTLLSNYEGEAFTVEQYEKIPLLFKKLKSEMPNKDAISLAESMLMLEKYIPKEKIAGICSELKHKLPFWPDSPDDEFNTKIWAGVALKSLSDFVDLTARVFSEDYMIQLLLKLPLRCWNSAVSALDNEKVYEKLIDTEKLSADALMWIWRNRKSLPQEVKALFAPEKISNAINKGIDNSATQASKLRDLFVLDVDFHKFLVELVEGHEIDILRAIQTCDPLRQDEKQSMLVKFSTQSKKIKEMLEKGEGRKMFASHQKQHRQQQQEEEETLTSIRSFKLLSAELEDVVRKQIPDNSAAIAHARSYGDLRENAEYKAAKERQAFLQKRRGELEMALNTLIPTNFADVVVNGVCSPGSKITLEYDKGADEVFYLLGVWDSDPDKNFLSSVSRLGKMLKNKKIGEAFEMPDGRKANIKNVEKLPDEMVQFLAEE